MELRTCPVCLNNKIRRLDQRTCGRECMAIWNTWSNSQKATALDQASGDLPLPTSVDSTEAEQRLKQFLSAGTEQSPAIPDFLKPPNNS